MIRGFTVKNWKLNLLGHLAEDCFSTDRKRGVSAVADGVTRDPLFFLPDYTRPFEMVYMSAQYNTRYLINNPARVASKLFCFHFPLALRDFKNKDERAVRESYAFANEKIWEWNQQNIPGTDYLVNDLAGCVAAGTVREKGKDTIAWGCICDCGVAVFDSKGDLKFKTETEGPPALDDLQHDPYTKGREWSHPQVRKRIRGYYRNNPNPQMQHSFGVLTGEKAAMNYVRTGTQEIKSDDYLLTYTDGLEPLIFSGGFADKLRQGDMKGLEKLCRKNVRTEGTLVIHKD